jgi:hypothetical protein
MIYFVLKEYFMAAVYRWLPTSRDAIIAMVIMWITICTIKRTLWGIAGVALTELTELKDAAVAAVALVKDESTRTKVTVAACKRVINELIAGMQDFKRRYFIKPPLTDEDFASLGLKAPKSTHTPIDPPESGPLFTIVQVGPGALGILYWDGMSGKKGSKPKGVEGVRVHYGFSKVPIKDPELLTKSEWATKCPHIIHFKPTERGMHVYIALKWEIRKEDGESPWSEVHDELVS